MKPTDLSPAFETRRAKLEEFATLPSPWQERARKAASRLDEEHERLDAVLQTLHESQRVMAVYAAGVQDDDTFARTAEDVDAPMWNSFESPPVAEDLQDNLAGMLYNVTDPARDYAIVRLGHMARHVGLRIVERLVDEGVKFDLDIDDPSFQNLLLNHAGDDGVRAFGALAVERARPATKRIVCVSDRDRVGLDPAKSKILAEATAENHRRALSGEVFFTLTEIPTKRSAEIDNIPYPDYIKLYFEMVDQPWTEIEKAQLALIDELDAAAAVRFTNDAGTDVTMDIEGFTFCNSMCKKNVPGSEAFSAPRRDSVNGTVVAPGKFHPPGLGGREVHDLTLHFKDGRIVDYNAAQGRETFADWLARDPGNFYTGELGIGTNPRLKRHVVNTLLVEKISGSFHLALGNAYTLTDYDGKKVKCDNGNRSRDHWDVTCMLYGRSGEMFLDGRKIMEDGRFIAPKYRVLNEGWKAVPVEERPDYWRDF